jgi:hypothetical protein
LGKPTSRVSVPELVLQRLPLSLGKRLNESQGLLLISKIPRLALTANSYVLTGDGVNNIIWWRSQKLGDYRELVDVILPWEKRLAFQHLCEDTSSTPDINLDIVLLPCEHNLRGSVVSRGDISSHLGILDTGQTEVADLQIAVFVDQDIAGFEVAMDNAC